MTPNQKAFLDMISISEGTYGKGDNGYNVIVGGALWEHGYADHPRVLVDFPKLGIKSTAAGRYQRAILMRIKNNLICLISRPHPKML